MKSCCCASMPAPTLSNALMNADAPKPQVDGKQPLLQLIEELSKKKDSNKSTSAATAFR